MPPSVQQQEPPDGTKDASQDVDNSGTWRSDTSPLHNVNYCTWICSSAHPYLVEEE